MAFRLSRNLLSASGFLVLFTGCLTIEENYSFKKDGSGTLEYVVDMSELGEMMKSFGEMSGSEGKSGDVGTMDMTGEMDAVKKIPGISKVKLDSKQEWVQRLSFHFKDLAALNGALNQLMPDSSGAQHEFFKWEGNTLVRTNNRHAYEVGAGMASGSEGEDADGDGEPDLDMSTMLEGMKYIYNFKFAQDITSLESASGVVRTDAGKREVKLDTDFKVIGSDPKALDLRIALDR